MEAHYAHARSTRRNFLDFVNAPQLHLDHPDMAALEEKVHVAATLVAKHFDAIEQLGKRLHRARRSATP
jgi:hypothetical protein